MDQSTMLLIDEQINRHMLRRLKTLNYSTVCVSKNPSFIPTLESMMAHMREFVDPTMSWSSIVNCLPGMTKDVEQLSEVTDSPAVLAREAKTVYLYEGGKFTIEYEEGVSYAQYVERIIERFHEQYQIVTDVRYVKVTYGRFVVRECFEIKYKDDYQAICEYALTSIQTKPL